MRGGCGGVGGWVGEWVSGWVGVGGVGGRAGRRGRWVVDVGICKCFMKAKKRRVI